MNKKVTVYRIEHPHTKLGPYKNEVTKYWMKRSHDHLPCPYEENLLDENEEIEKKYQCAFISKVSLNKWFNKAEIKRLYKIGYKVYKFKVNKEDMVKGKSQLIFKYGCKKYGVTILNKKEII